MRMLKMALLVGALALLGPAWASETISLPIPSPSMQKAPNATVICPDSYHNHGKRFRTVYLLHGWSGRDADWASHLPGVASG